MSSHRCSLTGRQRLPSWHPSGPPPPSHRFRRLLGAHVHSHRCSLKFREVGVLQDGRSTNWKSVLLDKSIPHCPFEGWSLPEWCLTAKQAVSHTGSGQSVTHLCIGSLSSLPQSPHPTFWAGCSNEVITFCKSRLDWKRVFAYVYSPGLIKCSVSA